MRIPLSWLKEYIHIDLSPSEIAKKLTMAGLEVDSYETLGANFSGIVVGRVLTAEKHPNADQLTVATVTDGKETYQVVCGAPNCRQGLKTAFAPVGAVIMEEGKEFKIKKAKLRGVESSGMLCSGKELNLSSDANGIMELPEEAAEGQSLSELYGDTLFDISLTPNLGHCASVIGVARELSAATGLPIHYPSIHFQEGSHLIEESVRLQVLDPEACPRYTCLVIKDVKVGPSPEWLKAKLEKCDLRSVNNIVDVTNYVLMEMGHPLHAFDLDRVEGREIIVKKAAEGELFETLDGKQRTLKDSYLMICDAKRPIAIAGVMGGANSEVNSDTCHIVLESAYFDPVSIRKTSKQLSLQTDASKRFERGTDPNLVPIALRRAAMLIQMVAGGDIQAGILDVRAKDFSEASIRCRLSRANQVVGLLLSRGEVETIFKSLEFHYQWDGEDSFLVRTPTYRTDLKEEIDLIEEIARVYGYDNISKQEGRASSSNLPSVPLYLFEKEVHSRLIAEGLQEFITCDLIGPTLMQIVQDKTIKPDALVSVLNPTSIEQSVLRTSLLPGLLEVVKYNIDHQNNQIRGFEIGKIHFKEGEHYKEQEVVAFVLTGPAQLAHFGSKAEDVDFFDLKGIVENMLEELGIGSVSYKNLALSTFHSGRQASVFVGELEIGSFGEIHPAIQRRLDVPQRILFGEFNLHDLMRVAKGLEKVKPLAIYPGSERDWTFTIKQAVPFVSVVEAIEEQRSPILEKVSLLDIYRSDKLGPEDQNMTLRFVYRDLSKTVDQETVEAEHQRLTTNVINKLKL